MGQASQGLLRRQRVRLRVAVRLVTSPQRRAPPMDLARLGLLRTQRVRLRSI